MGIVVRAGVESDLDPVNDIYNHYIAETPITFDVELTSLSWRREWFSHYAATGRYRFLVAADGPAVLGFATSSRHRPKGAYETSVETAVYVHSDATGRGIGTALYASLFAALDTEDVHRAVAGITVPNPASIALHERFGFRHVGTFTEQGRKFGRYWDVTWYEKPLPD